MKKIIRHLILIFTSFIFAFPFLWMISGIFKTNAEIWQTPYQLLPSSFNLDRILVCLANIHFGPYIMNSLVVGIIGSLLMITVAALFTYATVFMQGRYTSLLFTIVLVTYMLPGAVTYVPSYIILAKMGMLDKISGLIFSNLATVFAVFYLRQSFLKMSGDYVEAAKIDGAGHLSILWHIVLPLNKSAFYTVYVLTFIQQYNNYMWPSIILKSDEKYLISQALRQFFIQDGAYGMNWSEVMLASTVSILPVIAIFIIGQNWFMTGISQESGLK